MHITKKDDRLIIDGMNRKTFFKVEEAAIHLDLGVENIEVKNFNFVYLNSSSFINKLKNSITVLKYVWSK
jgi:hypothetical protein